MSKLKNKKVVIIADWLTNQGGAEQVVAAMSELFPESPIYTSVYTKGSVPVLDGKDIRGTWLQKLPLKLRKKHQFLLPFLPGAFERLDLSNFDVILSSSSAFSKSVRKKKKEQIHFCYCHTPTRYLYNARQEYLETYPLPWWLRPFKVFLPKLLDYLTKKDQKAAQNVDYFISNSDYIGQRIDTYYKQDSQTIYPCIEADRLLNSQRKRDDYFLAVGRFIPYKRFDLLVETFVKNGLPLKLGGTGPEMDRCKGLARGARNIEFLGFVPTEDLPNLYAGARAFLFPAEEDFGLTPVEAMCAGVPVVAYGKGGAIESVTPDTGIFFGEQSIESLQKSIDNFILNEQKFSSKKIKERGAQFDVKIFQENLIQFMEKNI